MCICPSGEPVKPKQKQIKPIVRLDKSGRKGKVVTMIMGLPRNEAYLRNLSKELKAKTGSGGTFYLDQDGGIVELQGDHRQVVLKFFGD